MSNLNVAKRRIIFLFATFICLSYASQLYASLNAEMSDGDILTLKGIGMHQELRNDIYLGALFGPASVTNVDLLLGDNVAKRMSIRFVSKYSARKMARHWKERLAMNNSRAEWQPLTKEIVLFSRIFKRNFQVGDEINIDHVPGVGTQVILNGTLFKTIKTAGFADLLLNVWLGTNPPTKAFKFGIRGENKTTLAAFSDTYESMYVDKGRFDADLIDVTKVASVSKVVEPPKTKLKETTVKKKAVQVSAAKTVKPPVLDKVAKTLAEAVVAEKIADKPIQTNDKPASNTKLDETALTDVEIAKPQIPALELKSSLIGSHKIVDKTADKVAIATKVETAKVEEPEEDFFDADLISGSYTRDLINAVRKFEKYPRKAFIRGEEGTVGARVTIGADGEVINVEILERSGSRILDRAVITMVKKAAPFEVIPKELNLETFDFDLPITFKL